MDCELDGDMEVLYRVLRCSSGELLVVLVGKEI